MLGLLPRIVPGWCPPSGVDGSSARELWLQMMSWLNLGLAGRYFAGRLLGMLAVAMAYPPRPVVAVTTRAIAPAGRRPAMPAAVVAVAVSRQPNLALERGLLAQGQIA